MALRSGYYGLKKKLLEKVTGIPAIKSIGSGLSLNPSTGELSATGVEVSVANVKETFKSEVVITDSPITDVESATKIRYGNLLFFTARVNKASNTAISKNFSLPLTFPETLESVCMIILNSPYGAGTASFDVNNKGMAVRYASADSATYVDISMILLVK